MIRTIIIIACCFYLAGLLLNPPIGAGPSNMPALFSLALDNQPVVRNVDVSPTLGLLVIVGFIFWLKRGGARW